MEIINTAKLFFYYLQLFENNNEDFLQDHCTPCPRGSFYNPSLNYWEWCTMEQFFKEDQNNYFNSNWKFCPPGTIGSQSGGWTACQPGYIYDPEFKGSCRLWPDDKFCPFATKYAFTKKNSDNMFESIQYAHSPEIYKETISRYDRSTMWVLMSMAILYIILYSLFFIFISISKTRKYGIKVLKEIDLNPITGGEKRLVVGGGKLINFTFYFTLLKLETKILYSNNNTLLSILAVLIISNYI